MQKLLAILSPVFLLVAAYEGYVIYKLRPPKPIVTLNPPAKHDLCNSLTYDYSKSDFEGVVNFNTAKIMADNYAATESNNAKLLFADKDGNIQGNGDARSVWFPIEKIKNFIWHIENQGCEKNCGHELGIRMYFARYPGVNDTLWDKNLNGVSKIYANRHTLFFVPTYYDGHTDVDFYPDSSCTVKFVDWAKLPPPPLGEVYSNPFKSQKTPYILMVAQSPTGDGQNHGNLIPPNDPAGTSF